MELTGVVEQIYPKDEKGDGSLKIGGKYYKYSVLNRRKDPWEPPQAVGQTVSLVYNESEYNGKTYNWVESVSTVEQFGEVDTMGAETTKVREPFRTPAQLMRTSAVEIATNLVIASSQPQQSADALVATVIAHADAIYQYIKSGLSD